MSNERGYGVPVDTDGVSPALESTRLLRLALNTLWDELPDDLNRAGPVRAAADSIHDPSPRTRVSSRPGTDACACWSAFAARR